MVYRMGTRIAQRAKADLDVAAEFYEESRNEFSASPDDGR